MKTQNILKAIAQFLIWTIFWLNLPIIFYSIFNYRKSELPELVLISIFIYSFLNYFIQYIYIFFLFKKKLNFLKYFLITILLFVLIYTLAVYGIIFYYLVYFAFGIIPNQVLILLKQKHKKVVLPVFILVSAISYLIAFPFIHLDYAIYQGDERMESNITAVTNFDLLNPTISIATPDDKDGYYITVNEYQRHRIIFLKPTEPASPQFYIQGAWDHDLGVFRSLSRTDFRVDYSYYKDKILRLDEYDIFETEEKSYNQEDKYFQEILDERLKSPNYKLARTVGNFYFLEKNMTMQEITDKVGFAERGYLPGKATDMPEDNYIIDKDGIIFIALGYDEKASERDFETNLQAKLQKVVLVTKDREFIEVPTKEDGTFDFETALEEVENQ